MINKLKSDVFFRQYTIFFSASMVVAFLNYIFHPILGRMLSPSDFGDVQALLSLIAQSAIIFGAFSVMVVNITTNIEDREKRNAIISQLQKIAFWVIGAIFICLLLSLTELRSFFNFSSIYPLVGLAIILPISALITFRNAYLQGTGNFKKLSLSGIISSSGKLIFVIGLTLFGLGVFGVTLGIILANIFVLIYLFYQTRESLSLNTKSNLHILEKGSINRELKYGILVFFAIGLITLYYTSDVLIIKHYFNSVDAGLYSGISAIAKILFFAVAPSSAVLLSSIKIKQTFRENSLNLRKSFIISFVVGGVGLFTFYLFSDIIIKLMIGAKYSSFAYLLPKVGLVMLLTSIANIFMYYFIALRRFSVIIVSLMGTTFLGFILFRGHSSINTILNNLLISLTVIIISLIIIYGKDYIYNHTRS